MKSKPTMNSLKEVISIEGKDTHPGTLLLRRAGMTIYTEVQRAVVRCIVGGELMVWLDARINESVWLSLGTLTVKASTTSSETK